MFEIFTNYFDFCLKFSCFNLSFSNKNIKGENRVLFIFSTICVNYRLFLSTLESLPAIQAAWHTLDADACFEFEMPMALADQHRPHHENFTTFFFKQIKNIMN